MSEEHLRPARPEPEGKKEAYGRRRGWIWPVVILVGATIFGVGYWYSQQQKAKTLREEITSAYQERVAPAAQKLRRFRSKLNGWIMKAAADEPDTWVDPRLKLSGLHGAQGVYLRLRAKDATSPQKIAEAAPEVTRDVIPRCMGLSPISLRTLYGKGDFLEREWLENAQSLDGVMELRVENMELARHIEEDLPLLTNMLRSEYFLLVLQRSEKRSKGPVDVYLWDLREDKQLLRVRTKPEGLLLPVRIRMGDAPRAPGRPKVRSPGATDCSIAAQVKELTGEPAMAVGADVGKQLEAARDQPQQAAADGGVADASPEADADAPSATDRNAAAQNDADAGT